MTLDQKRMLEILRELKKEYGIIAIKSEFEAEGSRTDEMIMLNEVVFRADLKLFIKVGGCEAIRDIDQCRLLGASGIMAPMIESPFAMEKFIGAVKKVYAAGELADMEMIINAETKICYENLDAILEKGKGFLDTVIVGRVDFSASCGMTRDDINSDIIYGYTRDICERSRKAGFKPGFGGGISPDAIDFLLKMADCAEKYETRKVVFPACKDPARIRAGLLLAMEFEMLYLKSKCDFYARMADEDFSRMEMLKARLEKIKG